MAKQSKADLLDKSSFLDRGEALTSSSKTTPAATSASSSGNAIPPSAASGNEGQAATSKPEQMPQQDIHESYREGIIALWRHLKGTEGISEIGYGLKNNDLKTDQLTLYVVGPESLQSIMDTAFRFQNSQQQSLTLPLELRVEGVHPFTLFSAEFAARNISEYVSETSLPVPTDSEISEKTRNRALPVQSGRFIQNALGSATNSGVPGERKIERLNESGTMGGWVRSANGEMLGITCQHVAAPVTDDAMLIIDRLRYGDETDRIRQHYFSVVPGFQYYRNYQRFDTEPGPGEMTFMQLMDAAALRPSVPEMVPPGIGSTGYFTCWNEHYRILGSAPPRVGYFACKVGRTTGLTGGKVISYGMPNPNVQRELNFLYNFRVENDSVTIVDNGDSGSLFITRNPSPEAADTWQVIGMVTQKLRYGTTNYGLSETTGVSPNRYGALAIDARSIETALGVVFP